MYKVLLTKEAVKYYQRSDKSTKKRLDSCFEALKNSPLENANVKRLVGELAGLYRYRSGNLRVIFKIEEDKIIIVVAIGARGDIYKKT